MEKNKEQCKTPLKDHIYASSRIPIASPIKSKNVYRRRKLDFSEADKENKDIFPFYDVDVCKKEPEANRLKYIFEKLHCDSVIGDILCSETKVKLNQARTTSDLVDICFGNSSIKNCLETRFVNDITSLSGKMGALKHGPLVSILSKNEFLNLLEFSWTDILEELAVKQTMLGRILFGVCVPDSQVICVKKFRESIPCIGMCYSMLMQGRIHYLSKVQRVISYCLH